MLSGPQQALMYCRELQNHWIEVSLTLLSIGVLLYLGARLGDMILNQVFVVFWSYLRITRLSQIVKDIYAILKNVLFKLLVISTFVILSNTIQPGAMHHIVKLLDPQVDAAKAYGIQTLYKLLNSRIDFHIVVSVSHRILDGMDTSDRMIAGVLLLGVVAYLPPYLGFGRACESLGDNSIMTGSSVASGNTLLNDFSSTIHVDSSTPKTKSQKKKAKRRANKKRAPKTPIPSSNRDSVLESDVDYKADNEGSSVPTKPTPKRFESTNYHLMKRTLRRGSIKKIKPASLVKSAILSRSSIDQSPDDLPAYESDSMVSMAMTEVYGGILWVSAPVQGVDCTSASRSPARPAIVVSAYGCSAADDLDINGDCSNMLAGLDNEPHNLPSLPSYEDAMASIVSTKDRTCDRYFNSELVPEARGLEVNRCYRYGKKDEVDAEIPIILVDGEQVDVSVLTEEDKVEPELVSPQKIGKGKERDISTPNTSGFLSVNYDSPFNPPKISTPYKFKKALVPDTSPTPHEQIDLPITPVRRPRSHDLYADMPHNFNLPAWALVDVSPYNGRSPEIYTPDDLPDLPPPPPLEGDEDFDAFMA